MGKIDPYNQQVSFDSGIRQETPGTSEKQVGRGLQHLGGAVEEAGGEMRTAARTLQEVKSREEVTSAQTKLFVADNELSTHLKQMEATADPEDRTLPEKFNSYVGDYLNKLAPRYETGHGEEAFRSGAGRLTAKLAVDAAIADSNIAAKSVTINYSKSLDAVRNGVFANPNTMHDQMLAMEGSLNDKEGQYALIPAIQRKALIKGTQEQIALSAVEGTIKLDPTQALKQLQGGLFSQYLDADKTYTLMRQAEIAIHAQDTEGDRLHKIQEWARHEETRKLEGQIVLQIGENKATKDTILYGMLSDGKTLLETDPERAMSLLNVLHARANELVKPVHSDPGTRLQLFTDIHRDANDPKKLKNDIAIDKAYIAGKLDKEDYNWLIKQRDDARTPDGEKLGRKKSDMISAVTKAIDKSNPMMGKMDPTGGLQVYKFQDFMEKEIERVKNEGKDTETLFDPDSKEFLGRPAIMQRFAKTWQESLAYITNSLRQAKGIEAPEGGTHPEQQRKPGEDAESYLKRFRDFIK